MKRISFKDIIEARGNPELLNEVSLGRVYQHVQKSPEKSLGIITAWRAARKRRENEDANKRLMNEIRSSGLGAFKLIGHWQECQIKGVPYEECPKDKLIDTIELSFGIVGIPKDRLAKMCRKYDQDAVVYLGPETKGEAILIFNNGTEQKIGKFSPSKIAQAYSKVRGGSFVFEGFEYPAQTTGEALIDDGLRVIYSTR